MSCSRRPAAWHWALTAWLFGFVLAHAAMTSAAVARSLDDTEKSALATTVAEFDGAMRNKNYERVVATVPPKVLAAIARKSNVDPEKLRAMMADFMKAMLKGVKIESFAMDVKATDNKETPTGAPYALVPTETVIATGDKGRFKQKSHTLALLDEGKWYLVRINDAQQLMIVREVYPEFTNVEFPQGSMEVLKQ